MHKTLEVGIPRIQVSWGEPSAGDKSGSVKLVNASHTAGDMFDVGSTRVSYTFTDASNNRVSCEFLVIVSQGKEIC